MKTTKLLVCTLLAATLAATSCDVARQARGAYNMVNCKYDFISIANVSVAGIDPSRMSLADAPRLLSLLSGGVQSIPVDFTLNLGVTNPGSTEAMLSGMDYVLAVDGVDFTSGSAVRGLTVAPGGTGTLPLSVAFDAATLLKGEAREAAAGIVRSLTGTGGEASKVTLRIRPSFDVAGRKISSPSFIPIEIGFGGNKK